MVPNNKLHVAIACGGTGGHIFPGLATAEILRDQGHDVVLWLAGKEGELKATEGWKGPIHQIKAQGLPAGFSLRSLKAALSLLRATWICYWLMLRDRPDVVLAMGSYASVGPVLAAWLHRIPIVLHEANVMPGKAIRFLARKATVVAAAFKESESYLPQVDLLVTGMPLRRTVEVRTAIACPAGLERDLFTFFVMGGSRGAHRLNEVLSQAFVMMKQDGQVFQVIHLTGVADETFVHDRYAGQHIPSIVKAFEHDMLPLYNASHFAICRAGAATCAELASCGMPTLFVPYPHAGNHQLLNARVMADAGMAEVFEEKELSVAQVVRLLTDRMDSPNQLAAMSAAAKRCAHEQAAEHLAAVVCGAVPQRV